jgi:hypothetical protein
MGTIYDFPRVRVTHELFVWIICSAQEINGDEKEVAVGIEICILAETNYHGLCTDWDLNVFVKAIVLEEYF